MFSKNNNYIHLTSFKFKMNKLLREVPTMESWVSGGSSEFVQVSLHQDFIKGALDGLKISVDNWLKEPIECCQNIGMFYNIMTSYYLWTNFMLLIAKLAFKTKFNGGLVA